MGRGRQLRLSGSSSKPVCVLSVTAQSSRHSRRPRYCARHTTVCSLPHYVSTVCCSLVSDDLQPFGRCDDLQGAAGAQHAGHGHSHESGRGVASHVSGACYESSLVQYVYCCVAVDLGLECILLFVVCVKWGEDRNEGRRVEPKKPRLEKSDQLMMWDKN